ncbi:MAG TPA: hypothetical protein VNO19_05625 [Gemmatimonadales bacterium]|nr:hypothetical protein [Gemmatimonadales bacterium]
MPTSLGRRVWIVLSAATIVGCSPLFGQWRVGTEVGAARFWGGSLDTGGDQTSLRPYRPTTFGLGLERQTGRYAVGLQVHYAEASLALEGPEGVVAAEGAFTIVSISPELAVRIATLGPGNQLRLHAGPLFERWDIIDQDARTRVGAQGSVSLDVPLGGRFDGVALVGVGVTPSPYEEGELDLGGGAPTYELRTLWRRSFALGLRFQL